MADNVARIIAGASAAFTASSMAISYATYRRVRPRLKVRGSFASVTVHEPDEGEPSYYLTVSVRNHGQTAVKIKQLSVELGDSSIERIRKHLMRRRRSHHYWFPRLPEDCVMEADAFGGVRWSLVLDDLDFSSLDSGKSHLRMAVELSSGVTIQGRWIRKPDWLPAVRGASGNGQLSFDDLTAQG
ncbi:hypothetical protein ACFV42_15420 [Streptomyces solisilvae]|uniref:hypothetical protein n=1 Tax=Streptomyces malaysiensis TaxID=92644 RepID=UPI0036AAF6D4